jgi:hypothetical protein
MAAHWRLAGAYLLSALLLSSVDFTHEWYSPLSTPEGPADWYSEVGLRNGAFVLGNHEPPGGRAHISAHLPEAFLLPVYAGAGPEGGGIFVAAWLACAVGWFVQMRRSSRRVSHHA